MFLFVVGKALSCVMCKQVSGDQLTSQTCFWFRVMKTRPVKPGFLWLADSSPVSELMSNSERYGETWAYDSSNPTEKPITVGWGKKETQFHGTAGKQAATRKSEDVKPALAWDDMNVRISWRGDGQYFAVSAISPDTGRLLQ